MIFYCFSTLSQAILLPMTILHLSSSHVLFAAKCLLASYIYTFTFVCGRVFA
eukprot:m.380936 g.380936  ORF g.380936 m.380936 type:complete len:52 (-) comp109382_c0_seq1:23-178(-)